MLIKAVDLQKYWTKSLSMTIQLYSNIHSVSYVYAVLPFYDVKCLCSRGREGEREESHSHKHFNIWFLWRKALWFEVEMSFFQPLYAMKLKTSTFKVLAFWSQWRYHYQIKGTRPLYNKNQILKCLWEWLSSLPHSRPPEHFTS